MWDTRYRPLVFSDVLGQEGSVRVLRSRLSKGSAFDTSYIFAGGHGCGKTTLARILARAMLCQDPRADGDPCNACEHCLACLNETMVALTELDAASQGTTADMRRIVDHLGYDIPGIPKRIYLLDEAHRMSRDAQDVLLKPIEDKRVVVLFCTTEYGKIRETIRSRCEIYEIRKIQREDILVRVQAILKQEGVAFEDEAILTVIDYAQGHVRDVLNKLEMIAQLGPLTMAAVRERLDLGVVAQYYDVLLSLGDATRVVELLESTCSRVSAPQVATGLAEAAMNAYRQAHKIHTDYSQFDREKARQVFDRFGADAVNVARYFLALGSYVTTLDLVCAAVAFGASGPSPQTNPRVLTPPVVVAAAPVPAVPSTIAPSPAVATSPPATSPPAPLAVVRPVPPEKPKAEPVRALPLPATSTRGFVDNNVPFSKEDEAGMSGDPPKGVGPAVQAYTPARKDTRPPPEPKSAGLNRAEFTVAFHDILKSLSNGK